MKCKNNLITFLIIIVHFSYSNDFHPINGSILNYNQIFFRWPQISNSSFYELYITSNSIQNTFYSQNNSIILNDLDWANDYYWFICGFNENGDLISCYENNFFNINQLPNNYPNNINILVNEQLEYSPGITILDFESLNFSLALNSQGYPVWFADRFNFTNNKILVDEFLDNGNFVGFSAGKGYEFNLDSEIIFQTSDEYGVHHDFNKSEYNTYFFIDAVIDSNMCPVECNENLPDMIPWQGDRFIELDQNGNLLWEWNTFDYLSLNEYNPLWVEDYTGSTEFDWTHSNSVYLEPLTDQVYISIRNLSRIVAIDYNTKEIIWNLGNPDFMNQIFFDEDFGFSHQHSAQITYDGNLLFFDNGRNNSPELSRCLEIEIINNQNPELIWEYILPDTLLTLSRGECDKLLNGNTLITAGRTGNVLEINDSNQIVWHLNAKDNNSNSISIYRSQRVFNLYPNAFSFKIDNLNGEYNEFYLNPNEENLIITIYNNSWLSQNFKYELYNYNNVLLLENSVTVSNDNEITIVENLNIDNNSYFNLKIYSEKNPDNFQSMLFTRDFISYDINDDNFINILDIIMVINLILEQISSENSADFNQDGVINLLDIIILVNSILN